MAVTFSTNATSGTVPFTLEVTDTSSPASAYANWDFGDPASGDLNVTSGGTASHIYGTPGDYTVTLSTDAGTATVVITVAPQYEITYGPQTLFIPIRQIDDDDFSSIGLRGLSSTYPQYWYDNGNYPLRTISLWPVPAQAFAIELWCWEPITQETDLDAELNLPPGYERYLRYKLAVEIAPEFGVEVAPAVLASLQEAENNIKRLNQQTPKAHPSAHYQSTSNGSGVPAIDIVGFQSGRWMLPGGR